MLGKVDLSSRHINSKCQCAGLDFGSKDTCGAGCSSNDADGGIRRRCTNDARSGICWRRQTRCSPDDTGRCTQGAGKAGCWTIRAPSQWRTKVLSSARCRSQSDWRTLASVIGNEGEPARLIADLGCLRCVFYFDLQLVALGTPGTKDRMNI